MRIIRKVVLMGCASACLIGSALAQDGLYGSFIVGQKLLNTEGLNKAIKDAGVTIADFPSNYWSFGGEGHVIIADHFVLGGKGTAIWWELEMENNPSNPADTLRKLAKVSGGMGIGSVGYAIGNKTLRLIPQVGVGVAPFVFQTKSAFANDTQKTFENIIKNGDNMVVLAKGGLVLDACLALDWYMPIIKMVSIIPGLETGLLIHAELGYTYSPANIYWMRDTDQLNSYYPDMKFDGMYIQAGVGIGLSSAK